MTREKKGTKKKKPKKKKKKKKKMMQKEKDEDEERKEVEENEEEEEEKEEEARVVEPFAAASPQIVLNRTEDVLQKYRSTSKTEIFHDTATIIIRLLNENKLKSLNLYCFKMIIRSWVMVMPFGDETDSLAGYSTPHVNVERCLETHRGKPEERMMCVEEGDAETSKQEGEEGPDDRDTAVRGGGTSVKEHAEEETEGRLCRKRLISVILGEFSSDSYRTTITGNSELVTLPTVGIQHRSQNAVVALVSTMNGMDAVAIDVELSGYDIRLSKVPKFPENWDSDITQKIKKKDNDSTFCMLLTVRWPKVIHRVVTWLKIIPAAAPFQLAQGTNMASRKTPSNGPDVAEVISIDDSITPESMATRKLMPTISTPDIALD
ncbi:hypothetical protein WN51_08365 [Melipona quadrifasciata]|uniref:Uncharacterized protein n=1 Tax=Melipona quadrifasciata TaxID=166423 RepID=A0A0N0BK70_9HYME|nr:hypothetical protein WN51_08365 [Melipona quadrifasciata]